MKRLKTVHPSTSILDPRATLENYEFAFNDSDLSDRVLHIEVMENSLNFKFDDEGCDRVLNRKSANEDLEHANEGDVTHNRSSDCSLVVKVINVHISSPIVAAKSPFFYKLFKNGMSESLQRDLTLSITSSEEAALVDVLKFMYNNTLSASTVSDLVDVLVVADKYEVVSCMGYCIEVL